MGSRSESHELNTLLDEECSDPNITPQAEALRVSDDSRVPIIVQRPAPAKLFRRTYLFFLVSLYSCLSIIAWTIICVQTHRPITTHTYSYEWSMDDVHDVLAKRMKSNAEWFRAAKICLAITNTLIIPLTSTVCASAAVIYVQNFGRRRHFSMQHTATLADKGWLNPQVWLALLSIKGWRSQGSYFLAFAMGFHALGKRMDHNLCSILSQHLCTVPMTGCADDNCQVLLLAPFNNTTLDKRRSSSRPSQRSLSNRQPMSTISFQTCLLEIINYRLRDSETNSLLYRVVTFNPIYGRRLHPVVQVIVLTILESLRSASRVL